MGGGAFKRAVAPGHPALNTPRMTVAEYTHLKSIYLARIQAYLSNRDAKVAVLKEAPGKADYGDLNVFVGIDEQIDFLELSNVVGATGLVVHNTANCSIGVPKDGAKSPSSPIQYHTRHNNGSSRSPSPVDVTPEEYAQIDVNVVPTDLVDWHVFYSAYGDLNGLLGHILTNLGFTVTDQGLWLRMKELDAAKEIERLNLADGSGKVFLTKDPEQTMRFLGLSVETWNSAFSTLDEFYDWLGACRMLHPVAIKLQRNKAHERNREQKREVYRRFIFEWLPDRMPETSETFDKEEQAKQIQQLRSKYLNEALDFFDKRTIYEDMHRPVVLAVNNTIASNLLRPLLAKHSDAKAKKLGELVRAFRRFVKFNDCDQPYAAETAHTDAQSQLYKFLDGNAQNLRDEAAAEDFVEQTWEKLKELESQRVKRGTAGNGGAPADEDVS